MEKRTDFKHLRLETCRKMNAQKTFKTSCQPLMYVPFTFSIQGSIDVLMILETKKL